MTEFLLVRHGETVWNREGRLQGQQDSPLSALGLVQVQAIAERLRHEPFGALYTSDLPRAYQTAQQIALATGHTLWVDVRLRERAYGIFEGLTYAEVEARHADLYAEFREPAADFVVPGGESLAALRQRAVTVFQDLANRHPAERLVVVAHGGLIGAFLRYVLGLTPTAPRPFHLYNAGLSQVVFAPVTQTWRAVSISDVTHLPPDA